MSDRWITPKHQNVRTAKALSHALRVRILTELAGQPMSPSRFARHHGLPLSTVSYHFRVLKEAGCIELVCERQVRGSVEHFYRTTRDLWQS